MKIDKKFALTVTISILVTILVYIGIVTSLERPTLSRTNLNSNHVGRYLGDSHPTTNNANYFVWKVTDEKNNFTYFIDNLNGEIVSEISQ